MNNLKLSFLFILFFQFVSAQKQPFYKSYDWNKNPDYKINANDTTNILGLKHKLVTEFYFENKNDFTEYVLEHKAIWLNSDDKIEQYNKVYLPYSSTSQLVVNKARVINPQGKILRLDESNIHTAQDEGNGRQYKYFAFEGIEKGSVIEYFYVEKKHPKYNGKKLTLQTSYDKREVDFDLYSPKNLVFKFKSYNGIPEVKLDTTSKDKLHWSLHTTNLKGIEEEELSPYDASMGGIIYKLDRNLANNTNDISSYGQVSQNVYSFYYPEYSRKTQSAISDFVSQATKGAGKDENDILRKLELDIKTNFYISKGSNDNLEDLDIILDKKVANESGITKLYAASLEALNIPNQLVLTSNRKDLKFDKDFEATNFLTDFLIYFPNESTYLSPTEIDSRYGYPPAYLTDNYGLFIKEVKVGNFKSAVGEIKYIDPVDADKTVDIMNIDVRFDKDNIQTTYVNLDRTMSGYYAMFIQPFAKLIKPDDKDKLIESLAKSMNDNIEITSKEMINGGADLFGVKPLEFKVDVKSDAFVEKAGNKYLFKVGELIGKQIQLYQKTERKLPLEDEYQRTYYRTINIKIPEGYKFVNLDDLNIDKSYIQDGQKVLSFKSFYDVKDGKVIITANEFYKQNIINIRIYEDYRKIVNSAADFNKITLVLQPK